MRAEAFRAKNKRAVTVGAITTIVLVPLTFVVPSYLSMELITAVKQSYYGITGEWYAGNPFDLLQVLVGPIAAIATSYLTEGKWYDRVSNSLRALAYGFVGVYSLIALYYVVESLFVGTTYVPILLIVFHPLLLLLPIGMSAVFGGIAGGLLGHVFRVVILEPADE